MHGELVCPGCRHPLDVISSSGRADDLYLCSHCYHSWFAFELLAGEEAPLANREELPEDE
ncbi:MAG: hypothetical protein LOD85_07135 [Clostridia bacterium]|nr:hypothetical protein [Bacillota bacterium]MBO2522034.1 hypothetical protein [Bacillota bacterium]